MLETWKDGPPKSAIVDFVRRVTTNGPDFVAAAERVAVFDNDGTLWCEKPAYVQLAFLVRQLAALAKTEPSLKGRQPYSAATSGDLAWFGNAVTKHYQGDDSDIKILGEAILSANSALTTEDHAARVSAFFDTAQHPTLHRPYTRCGYVPMVDLLRYLETHGFACYIASGGGRDFMRPITQLMYGIPPERIIGSSVGLDFQGGDLYTTARLEFLDDGPVKPVRIWGRTGRRPILAAGNSNGDIEMLQYTASHQKPSLPLLVLHDDAEREFAYTAGSEKALELAGQQGWTVTSIRDDWGTVFTG